ncbi:type VII secretion integral membrane protein EccD [Mycolicibacterium vaccae]|uniref:type VII secretion integral membrane protein EccD n=1 Tax=Mycolicibacterium vaccae TaxID=1810 RepID=UPI003D08E6EF
MRDSLLRVTVCAPRSHVPPVDLRVPSDCPVGALLPDLVDVVVSPSVDGSPRRWHLSHLTGGALDMSNNLRDNGIADGDVLVLDSTGVPAPRRSPLDAAVLIADLAREREAPPTTLREGAGLAVVLILAAVLAWPNDAGARVWCAAVLSAAAAIIVSADRRCPIPVTLGVGAAGFAFVTGFLAIPEAPWQVALSFGGAAGCAMAALLARATAATTLVAVSAGAGAITATAAVSAAPAWSVGAAGAALAAVSVAALTTAPRIALGVTGVSPARESIAPERAAMAHRLLTGLLVGWSATAALATLALTAQRTVAAVALAAVMAVLLVLRARHHADRCRRVALTSAGLTGAVASWVGATLLWPAQVPWLCLATAAPAVAGVYRWRNPPEWNPLARQGIQVVECVALVAVVPLMLWVTGVYGWVRGPAFP